MRPELHDLETVAIGVVTPAEADAAIGEGNEPIVGEGDAMGVAAVARECEPNGPLDCEVIQRYAHFLPSASRPARARSSGVIATRNSTSALKVRNHGSANVGIFDGSSRFTIMVAPRCPLRSVK
jgi:hypothetical protein